MGGDRPLKRRGASYKAFRDERQGPQADIRTEALHAHISSYRLLKVFGKGCIYGMRKMGCVKLPGVM